jgi:hypothetical protein
MQSHLLLWLVRLCMASVITVASARKLHRLRPSSPAWQAFLLASLASPLAWVAFQAAILPFVLADPEAHAGFVKRWPLYLREVVFDQAAKLWVCGALCAGFLAWNRSRSRDRTLADALGQLRLLHFGGACAAVVLLPMAMEHWIETGQMSGAFAFFVIASAFFVGFIPVAVVAVMLLRSFGAAGMRRFGEATAAVYALVILWRGYVWHSGVAAQPGASAVTAVEISALAGVFIGWMAVRRAIDAASAAAAARD